MYTIRETIEKYREGYEGEEEEKSRKTYKLNIVYTIVDDRGD